MTRGSESNANANTKTHEHQPTPVHTHARVPSRKRDKTRRLHTKSERGSVGCAAMTRQHLVKTSRANPASGGTGPWPLPVPPLPAASSPPRRSSKRRKPSSTAASSAASMPASESGRCAMRFISGSSTLVTCAFVCVWESRVPAHRFVYACRSAFRAHALVFF